MNQDRKGCFVNNEFTFWTAQGKYSIRPSHHDETKIWITAEGGEGGEFEAQAFYDVIDKFYKENF